MKKRILLAVTVIITAAIFLHSAMSAAQSSEESGFVLQMMDRLAEFFNAPQIFNEHTVRKLAHFTEFGIFGFFLSWTVLEYAGRFKGHIFMVLFFLLSVPVTDETIQCFSPGRSAEVKDVLLDFSGGIAGFLFIAAVAAIAAGRKRKKAEKAEKARE